MKTSGTFFLAFFFLFLPLSAFSSQPSESDSTILLLISDSEITTSLDHFRKSSLEQSRQWQKLMHRERNMFGIKSSQVSDDKFFLQNNLIEATNVPAQYKAFNELEATFVMFFEDLKKHEKLIDAPIEKLRRQSEKVIDHSSHSICRFPARLKFLKENLASDVWNKLPQPKCVFQNIYKEALDPKSVSFVFSSYYSDSPGSAFGHTFFRINRKKNNEFQRQELLDYGIGYAADVTTSNGMLYALLGLVGGFTGSWTNLPYYYKVREYNDFESRDLWSYDLELTPDEVDMLVLHLWEVGAHYYRYYFFTQNCAFHMLTMLEAAAPRLNLIDHVPFYYVIPSDSMKALFYEPGLVQNITFRPSLRHVFLERANSLSLDSKNQLQDFAKNSDPEIFKQQQSPNERALTLDAALDLVDLKNPQVDADTPEQKAAAKLKENLLNQRASIDYISPEIKISKEDGEDPRESHGSSRASLTYFEKNEVKSGFFNYRFALHDLLDPALGMPKNSQLEFFNLNFQLKPNELKLNDGNFFKVFNLNPLNFFERKLSWGMELGLQNKPQYCDSSEYACYLTGARARFGYSMHLGSDQATGWAMAIVNARHGDHLLKEKKLFFAPGYEIGMLYRFSNDHAFIATFGREFPLDLEYEQNYEVQYRLSIWQKAAVSALVINDAYGAGLYYYY